MPNTKIGRRENSIICTRPTMGRAQAKAARISRNQAIYGFLALPSSALTTGESRMVTNSSVKYQLSMYGAPVR